MNAKQLIAAAAVFAAAGSAFAQQTEFVAPDAGFVSSKTRAEVVAEMGQAYHEGTLVTQQRDGADTVQLARSNTAPGKTRADVVAELNQAYREGTLVTQQHDGAEQIRFAGTRSRDDVRREAMLAKQGKLDKAGS